MTTVRSKEGGELVGAVAHDSYSLRFLKRPISQNELAFLLSAFFFVHERTKNSRVRPMSRSDLAPAQTTAIGVRPSSVRSALTSIAVRRGRAKERN